MFDSIYINVVGSKFGRRGESVKPFPRSFYEFWLEVNYIMMFLGAESDSPRTSSLGIGRPLRRSPARPRLTCKYFPPCCSVVCLCAKISIVQTAVLTLLSSWRGLPFLWKRSRPVHVRLPMAPQQPPTANSYAVEINIKFLQFMFTS